MKYIPISELKLNHIYLVDGRNYFIALWDGREFIGIREKFGDTFLSEEDHWDTENRGTVKPYREIDKLEDYCHACGDDSKLFDYLKKIEDEKGSELYEELKRYEK